MQSPSPVLAKASRVAKPDWHVSLVDKANQRFPAREIWIKRGGALRAGSGPSGWKLRKSKVLARSLADRTHGR